MFVGDCEVLRENKIVYEKVYTFSNASSASLSEMMSPNDEIVADEATSKLVDWDDDMSSAGDVGGCSNGKTGTTGDAGCVWSVVFVPAINMIIKISTSKRQVSFRSKVWGSTMKIY